MISAFLLCRWCVLSVHIKLGVFFADTGRLLDFEHVFCYRRGSGMFLQHKGRICFCYIVKGVGFSNVLLHKGVGLLNVCLVATEGVVFLNVLFAVATLGGRIFQRMSDMFWLHKGVGFFI